MKISIKIDTMDLFRFNLAHTYSGISGILCILLSVIAAIVAVLSLDPQNLSGTIWIYLTALFCVFWTPCFLYYQSKRIADSEEYMKPLQYEFDEEGFWITQNFKKEKVLWKDIENTVNRRTQIVIYKSKKHAYILPKDKLAGKENTIWNLIIKNT